MLFQAAALGQCAQSRAVAPTEVAIDWNINNVMPKLVADSPGQVFRLLESAFERAVIASCLKQYDGNQVKTSESLGISRNTLRDRISRYAIY